MLLPRIVPDTAKSGRIRRRVHQRLSVQERIRRRMLVVAILYVGALTHCCVTAFSLDHHGIGNSGIPPGRQKSSDNVGIYQSVCLHMASLPKNGGADESNEKRKKKKKRVFEIADNNNGTGPSRTEMELLQRMTKLEAMVAKQEIEIQQLKQQCMQLAEAASAFGRVVNLLREAGLESTETPILEDEAEQEDRQEKIEASTEDLKKTPKIVQPTMEYFDDSEIFGRAPASVIDAADSAGAAILAGMLGGKQRMLVDVRDAELSKDPETLVQFIELAILPVAAGLEGLKSTRNRVKIVFPTVSQLLEYRRTMALAAPEVVALSTLGFGPVEKMDNLVVLVAPSPDDEEGLLAMNELLEPTDPKSDQIDQPLVVLNYHMVPVQGPAARFEVAYHLRLLSVQFMTGNHVPENFQKWEEEKMKGSGEEPISSDVLYGPDGEVLPLSSSSNETESDSQIPDEDEDAALEAAMKHAHELGANQGVTRAMVIRAYPRPWHVFVDTSPDTDADFEVAATFDEEPTQDDVNYAIVECLEGSEIEDELVAQQMQQALESGQLDRVSELLGQIPGLEDFATEESENKKAESNDHADNDENANDDESSDEHNDEPKSDPDR